MSCQWKADDFIYKVKMLLGKLERECNILYVIPAYIYDFIW